MMKQREEGNYGFNSPDHWRDAFLHSFESKPYAAPQFWLWFALGFFELTAIVTDPKGRSK